MTSEQGTRTAATVIADWLDEHGFGGVDTDELQSLSAALADAGYTICGPGQVAVPFDGSKRHREALAVYVVMLNDDEVAGITEQMDRLLPTRESE